MTDEKIKVNLNSLDELENSLLNIDDSAFTLQQCLKTSVCQKCKFFVPVDSGHPYSFASVCLFTSDLQRSLQWMLDNEDLWEER